MADTVIGASYEVLAEEGRRIRLETDGYQWRLGDLALEVEHLPTAERPRDPETGGFLKDEQQLLQRFAADIDIPLSTIRSYRQVAEAYPHEERGLHVGFWTHRWLITQEDRFDLIRDGITQREAKRLVAKRNSAGHHPPGWMELIGQVGDDLTRAKKDLTKAEDAITRQPNQKFREKAGRYADWADELAARLRKLAE